MCGLVAVLDPDGVPETLVPQGLAAIAHRGPDGRGTWMNAARTVALGHVRLAFTDRDGGRQPIANASGSTIAVVNGEHYDDEQERRRLVVAGHVFRTRCDAELLPHLWDEQGEGAFEGWRGELAAILWDASAQRLVAVRDRFGAKPLVWAQVGRRVLVASEARALFAMGLPPAWDVASVRHALGLQYTLPDRSLFAGVNVLPPGHRLSIGSDGVRVKRWWDSTSVRTEPIEAREAAQGLGQRLDEAVRTRMRGEREVGCLLSGGIDSAAVTALAARHSAARLKTFTVAFDVDGWDEGALARSQADAIGAEHHVVEVGERSIVDAFEDAITAGEGLAINGHVSAKWLLFQRIRACGVAAVLSGEGSDELLLGYPHLRLDLAPDDPVTLGRLKQSNVASTGVQLPDGATLPVEALERAYGFVPSFLRAKATLGARVRTVLREPWPERDPCDAFVGAHDPARDAGRPNVLRAARLWTESALATSILRTLGDAQEMAHGVEGRLPFLDPAFSTFALSLPVDVRIRAGREKWPLREAMQGLVTDSIRWREKHPFMAPPLTLSQRPRARAWLFDLCDSDAARAQPFFDPAKVRDRLASLGRLEPAAAASEEPVFLLFSSIVALQRRTLVLSPEVT